MFFQTAMCLYWLTRAYQSLTGEYAYYTPEWYLFIKFFRCPTEEETKRGNTETGAIFVIGVNRRSIEGNRWVFTLLIP